MKKKLYLGLLLLVFKCVYSVGSTSLNNNDSELIVGKSCNEKEKHIEMEMEMEMDSEINRRVLMMQNKKYISYETLKKDVVPCSNPGASYYNCHNSREANPYSRGCEVITGCARNIRS